MAFRLALGSDCKLLHRRAASSTFLTAKACSAFLVANIFFNSSNMSSFFASISSFDETSASLAETTPSSPPPQIDPLSCFEAFHELRVARLPSIASTLPDSAERERCPRVRHRRQRLGIPTSPPRRTAESSHPKVKHRFRPNDQQALHNLF